MKTPLHELLDFESELTRMFDSDERVAMAILDKIRASRKEMLEKERDVMIEFADSCFDEINDHGYRNVIEVIDEHYNETFNTKEK
jgi:hypothetical protein